MATSPSTPESRIVHEVDGIGEEDNRLPRWWLATFFIAIGFGYFYWQYYQVYRAGPTLTTEYYEAKDRLKPAPTTKEDELTDAKLVAMSKGAEAAEGAKVFATTCVACHGNNAEGRIGPNLTDSYWLHGGRPTDIVASISNGYPVHSMPAWLPILGPTKVRQVAAFVVSLRGTMAKGRGPEGLKVDAQGAPLSPPEAAPPLNAQAVAPSPAGGSAPPPSVN